jgi:uncharacterized membrane protein YqaE (UPF0057 family)
LAQLITPSIHSTNTSPVPENFSPTQKQPTQHAFHRQVCQLQQLPQRKTSMLTIYSDICKILLAIILPPLGVFLERGCNADFLINILLTVLGYIPVSSGLRTHHPSIAY